MNSKRGQKTSAILRDLGDVVAAALPRVIERVLIAGRRRVHHTVPKGAGDEEGAAKGLHRFGRAEQDQGSTGYT